MEPALIPRAYLGEELSKLIRQTANDSETLARAGCNLR